MGQDCAWRRSTAQRRRSGQRISVWTAEANVRAPAVWTNTTANQLTWGADGQQYSATGLAEQIFSTVMGRSPSSIRGTTWWVVDGDHIPEGVDPDEWAALADVDLAKLAEQVRDARSAGKD